jgi:hypothetical protein
MKSLNKSIANSPDEDCLSIEDYWFKIEASIKIQQSEGGSYNSISRMVPKEAIPSTGNLIFQISSGSKLDVYDMNNAYLKMRVNRFLTYTFKGAIANSAIVFLGDKYAANFFRQVRLYCNDTLIAESFDFVYETNLFGATFNDNIKYKYPKTFTAAFGVINYEPVAANAVYLRYSNVYGTYIDVNDLANGSIIQVENEIVIPMSPFNLLARFFFQKCKCLFSC